MKVAFAWIGALVISLGVVWTPSACGQEAPLDSTSLRVKRTTVWAACVPGMGQIMNRQIWKVPIVWGGLGYAVWSTQGNVEEFRASLDDLIALTDEDPFTTPVLRDEFGNLYTESALESAPCSTEETATSASCPSCWHMDSKCWTPTPAPCSEGWTRPTT